MHEAIRSFRAAPRMAWLAFTLFACAAIVALPAPRPARSAPPGAPPAPGPPSALTGRIAGRVMSTDRRPAAWAGVQIVELKRGTSTDEDGRYVLDQVPAGTWTIEVRSSGLDPARRVITIAAGQRVTADFVTRDRVVELPVVDVHAKAMDLKSSDKKREIGREDLALMKASSIAEAVSHVAGVVADAGGIHVRGGRATDNTTQISGVSSGNVLNEAAPSVPVVSVARLEMITGGMSAEDSEALSGVLKIETREGGERFGGDVRWDTDRFGDPTKSFDLYDRVSVGVGGPTPISSLTWFGAYEGSFSNTYLPSGVSRPRTTVFDFIHFGNRQSNDVNASLKLAWRPTPVDKTTIEFLQHRLVDTPYDHMWSRDGFVQVQWDTVRGTGGAAPSLRPRYGSWSETPVDSTYQPMRMSDHVPTTDDRFRQVTGTWIRQLSPQTVWTLRASNFGYSTLRSIGQKEPWEYDTQSPFFWAGNLAPGTENNPYFATHGDYPVYSRRRTQSWIAKTDLTSRRWTHHSWKAGAEARYHEISNLSLIGPNLESSGLPGGTRSSFHNFQPEGAAYFQDRWEFEGLILNAGLRYDTFTPGEQVPDADLPSGKRFKQQVSPSLGVAYPVSDRDALSFHYGWNYQTPPRTFVFEERGPLSSVAVRGNPDLEPETNVAYQGALKHLFSRDVSGQFAVFFRDIYGLVTSRTIRDESGNLVPHYVNEDYASARGFELSLSKGFSHHFSAQLDYTYSLAGGVASDPNSALAFFNGGRLYLPISERPLDWDQRHTLNLQLLVRDPGRWGFHLGWEYGSGLPFTPTFRNERRADPVLANSRRQPSRAVLNLDGDRYFKVWGVPMTLYFDARNVLDMTIIRSLSPGSINNPNVNLAGSDDYNTYYTETGRAGGAFLQDSNGDGTLDWVPVRDPRVFEEGRRVHLGVSASF